MDDITVKEVYFPDDLAVEDRRKEFDEKYEKFRYQIIEYKSNKTKTEQVDNQAKLIQTL